MVIHYEMDKLYIEQVKQFVLKLTSMSEVSDIEIKNMKNIEMKLL